MAWLREAIKEGRAPTTDEMDERDRSDPNHDTVMVMCNNGHWCRWNKHEPGEKTRRECGECVTTAFDTRTMCSLRTFDPKRARAKRR